MHTGSCGAASLIVTMAALLDCAFMAGWYVIVDGVEHGPLSPAKVKAAVAKGKITAETLMRKEGMGDAIPAGDIAGLLPGSEGTGRRRRSRRDGTTRRRKRSGSAAAPDAAAPDAAAPVDPAAAIANEVAVTADDGPAFDAFARDDDYVKHVNKHHISDHYYKEAAKAFLFPLSMNSMAFLLGYVVLLVLYTYAGIFLVKSWIGFEYIFFFLLIWFVIYGFAYLQRIGQRSAAGDMKAPVWPELGAMLEEIIGPGVVIFGAWVLFRLPYILVAWGEPAYLPASQGLNEILSGVDMYLCHAWDLLLRLPETGIEYLMQGIGFLIFPIGMLYIMVKGGFMGLKPGPMFRSMFEILPEYIYCLVLMLLCHAAMMLLLNFNFSSFGFDEPLSFATLSFDYLPQLSFLEVLRFTCVSIIPCGYLLMVQFRLMGLLYYTRSDKIE